MGVADASTSLSPVKTVRFSPQPTASSSPLWSFMLLIDIINKCSCLFCVRRTSDAILSFDACLQCGRPPHLARVPGIRFSCREMASELSSMSCDWEDDGKNLEGNVRYEQAEKQADFMLILIREAVNQNHRRYFLVSSTVPLFS
jgi:hypothetical protein